MRRLPLAVLFALLPLTSAGAQEIVVTGKSLKDTEAALKACLERKCPPDQDIAATLAHAENLFVSGDYTASRATMKASIGRNRKHGEAYPVPVSDLLRANSRIAEHLGEVRDYQLSVLDMRDTLKKGVGADDFRTLVAEIEVGDSRAKLGFPEESDRIFRNIEERALKLGQNRVASFARLRRALLAYVLSQKNPGDTYNRKLFNTRIAQLIDEPLPGGEEFVLAAEVIRAKVDRKGGSTASTDALVKRFAERGGADRPILLYAEPLERIDLTQGSTGDTPGANTLLYLTAANNYKQWADIGFWVGPDGKVSDVEVLRSNGSQGWLKPVLANVGKRVYAPLKQEGDATPGFYMVERYSLTARFMDESTGTNIRRREPTPRIERLDLTPETWNAPKEKG